jgi:hypothetical protein
VSPSPCADSTNTTLCILEYFRPTNQHLHHGLLDDTDRFMLAISQIAGKRLTYAALTGKTPSSV